jgi:hypothetical protein
MRMPTFILAVVVLTLVMAVAAWYAVASVNISGMMGTDFKAAEVIRERCPFHLVPPEWVAGKDETDKLLNWPISETKARLGLLLAVWVLSVAGFTRLSVRSPRHEQAA